MILRIFAVFLSIFIVFTYTPAKAEVPPVQKASLAKVLAKVMPAVVNIRVIAKPNPYLDMARAAKHLPPVKSGRIGSGVIINASKGYIVTNAHVVKDAKTIQVLLKDSQQFTGKLIGIDEDADIAVIQIHAQNLTALPLANSDDLQVGDFVAAIGSPYGLNQTVTSGIISALQRDNVERGNLDAFIQTDAPINPGNSGGALINMQGQFVGMNTAIITPDGGNAGIGFAIPANVVINVAKQLIKYGKVLRGIIGVMAQNVTPDIANSLHVTAGKGALVANVNAYSPAQEAGIKVGDIILKVNDEVINSAGELVSKMGLLRAGSKVSFTVLRHHQKQQLKAYVAPPAQVQAVTEKHNPYFYGVILQTNKEYIPEQGNVKGLRVLNIKEDSNADNAGLYPGDLIISANMTPINSVSQLMAMTENANKPVLLNVIRGSTALFVVLKPANPTQ